MALRGFVKRMAFSCFWKSRDKQFSEAHFNDWYAEVVKTGLKPMVKVAKMLKR